MVEGASYSYSYGANNFLNDTFTGGGCDWVSVYIYSVISILGLLGNASIIVVILLNPELRKSQINVLIVQLAIGDLLFILLMTPIKIEHEIHPHWQFGSAACKAYRFGETLAMGICVYSITAFSLGRFLGIVMKKGERNFTAVLVLAEWVIALTVAVPSVFIAGEESSPFGFIIYCSTTTETAAAKVYVAFWVCLLYVIPLVLIAYTNILVIIKLLQSTRKFSGEQVNRSLLKQFRIRRNRAAMFILITMSFAVFWMPYYAYRFWHIMGDGVPIENRFLDVLRKIHYFAAIANSCCNPYVMYMMSSKYRKALCCRLPPSKLGVSSANSIRSARIRTTRFSLSVK